MQSAELMLSLIERKAKQDENFLFNRLYRVLYNPDFYSYVWRKLGEPNQNPIGEYHWEDWMNLIQTERWYPIEKRDQEKKVLPEITMALLIQTCHQAIFASDENSFIADELSSMRTSSFHELGSRLRHATNRWLITFTIPIDLFDSWENCRKLLSIRCEDGRWLEIVRRYYVQKWFHPNRGNQRYGLQPLSFTLYKAIDTIVRRTFYGVEITYSYIRIHSQVHICIDAPLLKVKKIQHQLQTVFDEYGLPIAVYYLGRKGKRVVGPYQIQWQKSHQRWRVSLAEQELWDWLKPFMKNGEVCHVPHRIHLSVPQIIQSYSRDLKQFDYHTEAKKYFHKQRERFCDIHFLSLCKTIAAKEKSTVKKVIDKYGIRPTHDRKPAWKKSKKLILQAKDGERFVVYDRS